MAYWKHYHTPKSVNEAISTLAQYGGQASLIGGGTDMLLEIQQGHRPPVEALVDPTKIEGLDQITEEEGWIVIGCGVTHTQIVCDERIRSRGTCLAESCGVIGGPQVRNVGTLAGNIAHALPAGDGTIGLLTLGAEIEVASQDGTVWMPMEQSFLGPGKSTVDPASMLITRIRFRPTGEQEASAYRRVMRPQGVALPMIAMGSRLQLDGDTIVDARVTIGPAGPIPFASQQAAAYLQGRPADDPSFQEAARRALDEATLRTSKHRATSEYREMMIRTLLPQTLAKAAERARTGHVEPEGIGL